MNRALASADRMRLAAMPKAAPTQDGQDRGSEGAAALARRLVQMPTEAAGVYCRQVVDPGPLHGLRLEQRQLDAAAELTRLWREALPGRAQPGSYAGGGKAGRHLSPEEEQAAGDAARDYRAALDAVQWACGVSGVIALETALIYRERAHHAGLLPGALGALADHWRMG